MTQAAVPQYAHLTSDGVLTVFPYGYFIGATTEIEVYVNGTLTTAYTVTGIGSANGGTLVFFTPPPTGTVFHRRVTPQTQLIDYVDNDAFGAETSEFGIDKIVRMIQDLTEQLSRRPGLTQAVSSALRNLTLPLPGALKLFGWNADGTAITLTDSTLLTIVVDPVSGRTAGKTTTTVNASSGAGTTLLTASAAVPAGVLLLGVTARVVTTCGASGGLTTWTLGDADTIERWGTGISRSSPTVTNAGMWRAYRPTPILSAQNLLLLADGGLWDSVGQIRLTCHWEIYAPDA